MRRGFQAVLGFSLIMTLVSLAPAAMISTAVKIAGNNTPINLVNGGLADGVLAFTDRDHLLAEIPAGLVGGDLVQVSNSDKTSVPYQVEVSVNSLTLLYVGLDNRITDGDANTPASPLPWMSNPTGSSTRTRTSVLMREATAPSTSISRCGSRWRRPAPTSCSSRTTAAAATTTSFWAATRWCPSRRRWSWRLPDSLVCWPCCGGGDAKR